MGKLEEKLKQYADSGYYRFHMPGHKGNSLREHYRLDITEIDGFDNFHDPQEFLREEMERAKEFYASKRTYYLINGSTCGILAAVSAAVGEGGAIALARNSHKAAYNACYLNGLKIFSIYPQIVDKFGINGGIPAEEVENLLKAHRDIRAVFITSPTYEGVVSDIEAIAKAAHDRGVLLIVDEAHGAHFGMHRRFPESALDKGADVVVQSLHKTLDSMTQTAVLHIGKNSLADEEKIERYLDIYQSTSPSYILIESISRCMEELQAGREKEFGEYVKMLEEFYENAKKWKNLSVLSDRIIGADGVFDRDVGKLVISCRNMHMTGKELYDNLRENYLLQPEMASGDYVICMTSYKDTREGFERLTRALTQIDAEIAIAKTGKEEKKLRRERTVFRGVAPMTVREALDFPGRKQVPLQEAAGKVSAGYLYIYPPGIPLIIPGERILQEDIRRIEESEEMGLEVKGYSSRQGKYIEIAEVEYG